MDTNTAAAARIRDRYLAMSSEERSEERTHQRAMLNNDNLPTADRDRAALRLDTLDEVEAAAAECEHHVAGRGSSSYAPRAVFEG